ncbi:unnamed protein product [Penicillium bialowiezense]
MHTNEPPILVVWGIDHKAAIYDPRKGPRSTDNVESQTGSDSESSPSLNPFIPCLISSSPHAHTPNPHYRFRVTKIHIRHICDIEHPHLDAHNVENPFLPPPKKNSLVTQLQSRSHW